MSRYSKLARTLALVALPILSLAAACGSDDDDGDSSSTHGGAGTTSSAAGAEQGGTTADGGAEQGGSTAQGGATDGGASTAGSAGDQAGGSAGAGPGGGSGGDGGAGGSALPERRVFVSSITFVGGALGGLTGADDECQAMADAEDLGGTWLAWLSDSTGSPSTRFVQSSLPYVRIDGQQVAADWADLTDGALDNAIDVDQSGATIDPEGNVMVWTGTSPDGTQYAGNCNLWADMATGGFWGVATASDTMWSAGSGQACSNEAHLYCFEQYLP